jgi:hypothetical protein
VCSTSLAQQLLFDLGSFDIEPGRQSLTDGDPAKHTWKHLCVRDGKLVGGVFVNAPLAAMAAINAAKKSDARLSDEEIDDILHKDN